MGSNPSTESSTNSIRKATDNMQMLCKGSRLQPKAGSQRISTTAQQQDLIKGKIVSGHEYIVPDANKQLHLLLPTHEMWELSTPLIAANKPSREMRDTGVTRSVSEGHGNYPLGLEHSILSIHSKAHNPCSILSCKQAHIRTSNLLCNNYYKQGPRNGDPPPAKPTQATTQGPKHRKATAGSYELNQRYPTPSNSAESSKQHKTGSEHLPQQARSEIRRFQTTEGRCLRTPHQLQANVRKVVPNEASQQEESNATTLALVGAIYHRQSKKIGFGEQ
ncbi:hypothetical protein F511_08959 [Dorcoceras hygrometricum]|uniref:Uncharacterized protein n=1 Tax=Dorcoceras hygrometricum TaxID=472368 RepID=A0A2Z7CSE2_9LAMI|nr:hypothetical protein F511_08959 [Dorcoceras hygrometricum]